MAKPGREPMKHTWTIEPTDIKKVKAFLDLHRDDLFVRQRIEWNLCDEKPAVEKEDFWQQMVACLLTTQQRSGPRTQLPGSSGPCRSRWPTRPASHSPTPSDSPKPP